MDIIKRTGEVVEFDRQKIYNAIFKAFHSSGESSNISLDSESISEDVSKKLFFNKNDNISVETIQDEVEKSLMEYKFFSTAKAYILYREAHSKIRPQIVDSAVSNIFHESSKFFDNDTMREFVFMRTYAKWNETLGRRETWIECVERYISFMKENIGNRLSHDEYEEIKLSILKQEVMPSMRLLQFAGNAARRCNVCIYNCAFTAPENFKDLADIIYILMSGTGVGFSVEAVHVEKFPVIQKQKDSPIHHYVVEDSKQGWADAYLKGLELWFSGEDIVFDYSKLRPLGARLKTSGGRSSGPQPLIDLMDFTKSIIMKKQGVKLLPINIYDIICKIGQIVVAGGTRRSALLSLSDLKDTEIRDAKTGAFWNSHPQRVMANNSAVYNEKPSMTEFMREWLSLAESGTGERGIFNRGGLSKSLPQRRLDFLESDIGHVGVNPCSEIILKPRQKCNLTEVICRADDTLESLLKKARIATILGTYQATLTNFQYLSPQWKVNQEAERLLGVSLSGQWDCSAVRDSDLLSKLKDCCLETNKIFSKRFGINESNSITCVKPSGSVSQLVNCASGIHPRFSKYYIRRIRISSTDPLLKLMRDQGFNCNPEVGQSEQTATTFVLDFPVKAPENAICVSDVNALQQLEYWKTCKVAYIEHSISATIYVKEDEWLLVAQWIWDNWDYVSGLSFLPYSDHVYQLAPYEEINKEKYEDLASKMTHVDFSKLVYYEKVDNTDVKREFACVGDKCEL